MRSYSLIAQSVERRTVNPQVPGSSPGRGAKFKSHAKQRGFFFACRLGVGKPQSFICRPTDF